MANMYAKFDEEAQNNLQLNLSIMVTQGRRKMWLL